VTLVADIPLRGAGGEPVDFARTIASHGVAELPPNRLDLEARVLETTLPILAARAQSGSRSVAASSASMPSPTVSTRVRDALTTTVSHMFRFDENLFDFSKLVKEDGELSWCAVGAGRMLRAPTVFEDVVKTRCTPIRQPNRICAAGRLSGSTSTWVLE
jgi:3-methyladenine DNA glycosylase/8-oxoguanine DNA glycosylase